MKNPDLFSESNQATYCPEDDKLRLYVGRVPKEEYLALRAEGWTATPKQSEAGQGEFAATWTPARRDTAESYAGIITDEDAGPQERAADRAERFSGYLDKRLSEATGHADRYDSGPQVHGFQSQARAERAAARHDRIADRSLDAWSKAEYWQSRTAGVISSALYKSSPGVRMGRIKVIESEIRKIEASYKRAHAEKCITHSVLLAVVEHAEGKREKLLPFPGWQYTAPYIREADGLVSDAPLTPEQLRRCMVAATFSGEYSGVWSDLRVKIMNGEIEAAAVARQWLDSHGWEAPEAFDFSKTDWHQHLTLRLAYENQMLEAQGGRAACVEMEVGGWIGNRQIRKVNKSPATGRVVSVTLKIQGDRWGNSSEGFHLRAFNIERLPQDAYRAPSEEDKAALLSERKSEKASAPAKDPCPLINPTDEDAEKLQAIWNTVKAISYEREPAKVTRMTQAQYSELSKGTYARAEAKLIATGGKEPRSSYGRAMEKAICKVRFHSFSVIILTDKPQKPLPAEAFNDPQPARLAIVQEQFAELLEIDRLLRGSMSDTGKILTSEQEQLFLLARLVGYAYYDSLSQRGITSKGYEWAKENAAHLVTA